MQAFGLSPTCLPSRHQRRGWYVSALRAAAVSGLLIALLLAWSRMQPPAAALHGTPLSPVSAPDFSGLADTQGRAFSWGRERGRAVLVFFGYAHCPDVCPLTLAALSQSLARLGPLRRKVTVVFVTLDPARDGPQVLQAYLDALLPGAIGLRGPLTEVAASARQWGVTWRRVDTGPGQYWIDHTAAVTLVGPTGRLLARYGYGQLTHPAWLADDLRPLLEQP